MDKLRDTIATVFRRQFSSARLLNTIVLPDIDFDGDEILRITFVFEAGEAGLDVQKVKSLIRHLREPLAALQEHRFPVITFMTAEEYSGEAA